MNVVFEKNIPRLVCRFSGKWNCEACSELEPELARQVSGEITEVEFDLRDVPLITSAFLRLCVIYYKKLGLQKFHVANMNDNVKSVFELSGLIDIMAYTDKGKRLDLSG